VFAFGNDIFIVSLGSQLINTSQAILLTRLLGLDAAAAWNIGTRTYVLLTQLIFRIFDFSTPALAEMVVRGEKSLLAERFKQIVVVSLGGAVAAGGIFALCNSAFVTVWTHGRISWPPVNDLLLALWLVVCVAMHAHTGLVGVSKKLQFMRFIFFIEGSAFVGLTLAFYQHGGITAMLTASIVCTCLFSLPYGLYRTRKYFNLGWRELALWHRSALVLAFWLLPAGILTWCLAGVLSDYVAAALRHSDSRTAAWLLKHNLPAMLRLGLGGGVFGLWTIWAFLRHGLNPQLQNEMARRLPAWTKSMLPLPLLKSET
jgi:O-antigen/teichoic acid export membrane protein